MKLELREYIYEDDEPCDRCNQPTYAILKLNGITIPLCRECLADLAKQSETLLNQPFCCKCKSFLQSKSGWEYGGSCNKNGDIDSADAGYVNCCDNFGYCQDFSSKEK